LSKSGDALEADVRKQRNICAALDGRLSDANAAVQRLKELLARKKESLINTVLGGGAMESFMVRNLFNCRVGACDVLTLRLRDACVRAGSTGGAAARGREGGRCFGSDHRVEERVQRWPCECCGFTHMQPVRAPVHSSRRGGVRAEDRPEGQAIAHSRASEDG